jgi:protein SYS1
MADELQWWNPRKLLLQMLLVQLSYTLTAMLLITFVALIMAYPLRLDYVLLERPFRMDVVYGWALAFLFVLSSFFTYAISNSLTDVSSIIYLVLIVRRSQYIVDFVLTLEFFHLIFTMLYNKHFPTKLLWWLTHLCEIAIMIPGGRYFCRMRELRPIEFGTYEMLDTDPERQDSEPTYTEDNETS